MGALLFLIFILVIISSVIDAARSMNKLQQKQGEKQKDFVVEDVKKFCPPHKWRYQEVKDPEGNTVRWRIICDICGPLKPADGPARLG